MTFAGAHFALSKIDPNTKKSRMETLHDIRKQTGFTPSELAALPAVPRGTEHIWMWFCALGSARQNNGFDTNPIGWSDMAAYFRLLRIEPDQWEVMALRALDDLYLESRQSGYTATARSAAELTNTMGVNRNEKG